MALVEDQRHRQYDRHYLSDQITIGRVGSDRPLFCLQSIRVDNYRPGLQKLPHRSGWDALFPRNRQMRMCSEVRQNDGILFASENSGDDSCAMDRLFTLDKPRTHCIPARKWLHTPYISTSVAICKAWGLKNAERSASTWWRIIWQTFGDKPQKFAKSSWLTDSPASSSSSDDSSLESSARSRDSQWLVVCSVFFFRFSFLFLSAPQW